MRGVSLRRGAILSALLAGASVVAARPALETGPAFLSPGIHNLRLAHDGLDRWYRLHVPPQAASGTPLPLVLALHGGGGNPRQFSRSSGFEALSDREGFVVAFPAGTSKRFDAFLLTWNAGHCCGSARTQAVDDIGFLGAVLEDLPSRAAVDLDRTYLLGHSNGAMMTMHAAGGLPGRFAAIASLAGASGGQASTGGPVVRARPPTPPLSALFIHGRRDRHVLFQGGSSQGVDRGRLDLSFSQSLEIWTEALQCAPSATTELLDEGDRIEHSYACSGGTEVRWIDLPRHGHTWPGAKTGRIGKFLQQRRMRKAKGPDPVESNLDLTTRIWDFFRDKHRGRPTAR